jgi:hypothetical protein
VVIVVSIVIPNEDVCLYELVWGCAGEDYVLRRNPKLLRGRASNENLAKVNSKKRTRTLTDMPIMSQINGTCQVDERRHVWKQRS